MNEDAFPMALAAEITGVGRQTIELWDRRDFLKPSIRGALSPKRSRSYSFADLVAIRVADELHRGGMELRHMRRIIERLRQRTELAGSKSDIEAMTMLIVAGPELFETTWTTTLSDILQRTGQRISLLIPLGEIVAQIKSNARSSRTTGSARRLTL